MTEDEAVGLVARLVDAYPGAKVRDGTVAVYAAALAPFDRAAVAAAVATHVATSKWFPAVAEVLALVAEAVVGLPEAGDAWRLVLDRMRETYPGHPAPDWRAPVAVQRAAAALGGIHALRLSEEPSRDRERFVKVYGTYRDRALRDVATGAALDGGALAAIPPGEAEEEVA